jgi:hypothetical protein
MYKLMKESDNMMNDAMTTLMKTIKEDYYRWTSRNYTKELSEINVNMINEFNENLTFEEGRKYIKVISNRSVWGFIMKADDKMFKAGDILKAAGYNAPARNKARGNIFTDLSWVQWTGPAYL